jgi:hypothetical protein
MIPSPVIPSPVIQFDEYGVRVQQRIEEGYGIRVLTTDVPDPLTGDLNGLEIQIDYAVSAEQRLFLLLHLFGHTVQWNVNPRSFEIGRPRRPPVDQRLLPEIVEYEREAASYALTLLLETGITGLDQWLSDYTACDMAYLEHYYRTGEKREFSVFWRDKTSLLEPKPVPAFTPAQRRFRSDGIVI